jgi:flagellar export protein FliJ
MKKFVFSLDKLERVRTIEMERAAIELATTERQRATIEYQLELGRLELDGCHEARRLQLGQRIDVDALINLEYYTQVVTDNVKKTESDLSKAKEQEALSRAILLEKAVRRKVVSKYRERRYNDYEKDAETINQKELDETAGNMRLKK